MQSRNLWHLPEVNLSTCIAGVPYFTCMNSGIKADDCCFYGVHHYAQVMHVTVTDELEAQAAAHWDTFYQQNKTRFFKDRHYLDREFPELATGECTILEVQHTPVSKDAGIQSYLLMRSVFDFVLCDTSNIPS